MKRLRSALVFLAAAVIAFAIVRAPGVAFAQMGNDRPIGIKSEIERHVFSKLRCMCGGCSRLPLSECTCGYAADRRDEIRAEISDGMTEEAMLTLYAKRFGTESLEIPSNVGANRLLYIVPITAVIAGAIGVGFLLRRLRRGGGGGPGPNPGAPSSAVKRDDYDEKLDDELRRLDDE